MKAQVADPELTVWWSTSVECVSALSLRLRMNQIDNTVRDTGMARLATTRRQWTVVPPSLELRDHAERLLLVYPLRAAGALQLAAALKAAEGSPGTLPFTGTLPFICLDNRLSAAARSEGFIVEP